MYGCESERGSVYGCVCVLARVVVSKVTANELVHTIINLCVCVYAYTQQGGVYVCARGSERGMPHTIIYAPSKGGCMYCVYAFVGAFIYQCVGLCIIVYGRYVIPHIRRYTR